MDKDIRTMHLELWTDFPKAIADIREEFGTRPLQFGDTPSGVVRNQVLFRGQSDSAWGLETTLERTTEKRYSIPEYLGRTDLALNEIESLTGRAWGLTPIGTTIDELRAHPDSVRPHLPWYEYLVYLRHHGFPSPLLDWTRSPYIAAYFALEQKNDANRCSVFAFIETPDGGKTSGEDDVLVTSMGPYVTTHNRHFAQKASYTIATRWSKDANAHFFCSHRDVTPPLDGIQDVFIKIAIPRSDRILALRQLEDCNISRYTLFQSEDSLVWSLGLRVIELDGN